MINLRNFSWSSILLLLVVLLTCSPPALSFAVSYEDAMEPYYKAAYKLQNSGGRIPINVIRYPPSSSDEKLTSIRSRWESLAGVQPLFGLHKKFDTLSGGSFGKRQAASMSELDNFVQRTERDTHNMARSS